MSALNVTPFRTRTPLTVQEVRQRLGAPEHGNARCPAHEDKHASLSVSAGENGRVILKCHAGCDTQAVLDKLGLTFADISGELNVAARQRDVAAQRRPQIVARYPYRDASGKLLFETVRYEPKDFRQRRPDGRGGWLWNLDGVPRIPYRLPEVLKAIQESRTIYIVEGEKDVETVIRHGLVATCNALGAGKWTDEHSAYLAGADVVIVPDNDEPGRRHAVAVGKSLEKHVHLLAYASVPAPYKDVSECVQAVGFEALQAALVTSGTAVPPALQAEPDAVTVPEATAEPRFQLLTFDDLKNRPPVAYLDDNHELVAGGLNVLYARRGAGKSFIALDYSLNLSLDHPVVYVAGEGVSGYPDRIAAYLNHHRREPGQFRFVDHAVRMLNPDDVTAFIAAVQPVKPSLIVLDTLARCFSGGDENNTRDMTLFIEACERLRRETGAALLVVHHTGKALNGTRGSIVLEDAADMVISLTNDDGVIKLACDKSKDSEPFPPRFLQLMATDARPGSRSCVVMPSNRVIQTPVDKLTEQQAKVLEALALETFAEAGAKASILIKTTGVPESSIYKTLSTLKRLGYVRQAQSGDPYYITPEGKQRLSALSSLSKRYHDSGDSESGESKKRESKTRACPLCGEPRQLTTGGSEHCVNPKCSVGAKHAHEVKA